ncbi:30S ribosomal protein S18 [Patescibacteria group bacterium]|nr:MAG: 30S ribosomal protein S18 [Patescibacteria group bacterium]
MQKQRHCHFCANKIDEVDYKDVTLIRRFLSSFAKIVARKRSGVCMKHQRQLANAVKRARIMALVPFVQR